MIQSSIYNVSALPPAYFHCIGKSKDEWLAEFSIGNAIHPLLCLACKQEIVSFNKSFFLAEND